MEVRKLDLITSSTKPDIFVTIAGTDNKGVIMAHHLAQRKNDDATVENIGNFDNEIKIRVIKDINHKDTRIEVPDGLLATVLAKGRLPNLGSATGHPSLVKWCSHANQAFAQIELF